MLSIEGIERLVEPVFEQLGLVLHGAEVRREGRALVLRFVVDKGDKGATGTGVTVDELARASEEVGALLDLENPIDDRYRLTIESPGIERELSNWRQMRYAVGERVRVVTRGEESRVVEGDLTCADDESRRIEVLTDAGAESIDFADVKSARTVYLWENETGQKRKF